MDTFVNSSWYFLRYTDPKNSEKIFEKEKAMKWCPIDTYIGGAEHSCMHLIYFRFYTKFLRDIGLIDFDEPAKRLFHQGMLLDKEGTKMSKSKPETCVLPEEISKEYGIDTARFFLSGLASPDKNIEWSDAGIKGSLKFIKRVFRHFSSEFSEDSKKLIEKRDRAVKNCEKYFENFQYRKANIELRELFELMESEGSGKETRGTFLKLLNPICPHITEELWEGLGNRGLLCNESWPKAKEVAEKKEEIDINKRVEEAVKKVIEGLKKKSVAFSKAYAYVMPFEIDRIDKSKICVPVPLEVFSTSDKEKIDPANKAKKARPKQPSVYVE